MAIDTTTPNTPGWWLARLLAELNAKRARYELLDSYYRGDQPIPHTSTKAMREAYRRLMALSRTNFAELIVEAVRERMMPQAFRTGAVSDGIGDSEAWRIWQANSLDADVDLILTPQLSMGASYLIVGPVDNDIGAPVITPEDPRQVTAAYDPIRRRKVTAALKVYRDDVAGTDVAYLYLPGVVHRVARDAHGNDLLLDDTDWLPDGPPSVLPDGIGVPVVPFLNRSDRDYRTQSETEGHLGLLDRINYSVLERVEIATLQAFRQRAIKGDLPTTDQDGVAIDYDDVFAADPGALWVVPSTVELWESGQVDLGPIRQAVRDDVQDLAAVTRTPLYYLTPDATNGSAEGAALAREGLIFKAEARIRQASESLEAAMALAFAFAGDTQRASRRDMEVIWAAPERHSLAERADAASKAIAAGVPWRTVMTEIMQFSAQEVDRMAAERAGDMMLAAMQTPPVVPQAAVPMPPTQPEEVPAGAG